jgi:hypothetical protein
MHDGGYILSFFTWPLSECAACPCQYENYTQRAVYKLHAAYNNLKCHILEVTVLSESAFNLLHCYGEDTDCTFNLLGN